MTERVIVSVDSNIGRINPNLHGQFIEHLGNCVYDGIWVGEDSGIRNKNGIRSNVVDALKSLGPPVVRWPGGCFADDYHWRDGIGPPPRRPRRVNVHWGMGTEGNEFGTHEFIDFCRQIGAEPYICGNLGTGTVREMRDWLEYLNYEGDSSLAEERASNGHPDPFNVKYFGIGNESWGCGGNMDPGFYAHQVRRYSSYLHFWGDSLYRIACGPCGGDTGWTRKFFETLTGSGSNARNCIGNIDGFALHYYCGTSGSATEYSEGQWYGLLAKSMEIESLIVDHRAAMDKFDPERKVDLVVDEWGTWHEVMPGTNPRFLRQQNTIRDALVAAIALDVFNRHSGSLAMANIAQTVNVLQSMILTQGSEMILTPTYHVFEMYSPHRGCDSLRTMIDTRQIEFESEIGRSSIPMLAGSSSARAGYVHVSLVNTSVSEWARTEVELHGAGSPELESWRVLAAEDIHDHNTFDQPERVKPEDMGPGDVLELPPASVNVMRYRLGERYLSETSRP